MPEDSNSRPTREKERHPRDKYSLLLEDKEVRRWYDNVSRGSTITADVYLRRLGSFCQDRELTPAALIEMKPKELEKMLLDLVTDMQKKGKAGSYISSNVKAVKSWLAFNDIEIKNGKIKIEGVQDTPSLKNETPPDLDKLRNIFLACNSKQRVAAVLIAHAGLRPETLGSYKGDDGLKISDFPEIEIRRRRVSFKKVPTFITVRSNLSKAGHEYLTLLSEEGCGYLKEELEDRMRRREKLKPDSSIIAPKVPTGRPFIRTSNIGDLLRKAIRKAGFKWRPYVLRSFFDTQTMLAESRGLMLKDYRVFFMGHKGDIERNYTLGKRKLAPEVLESLRSAYKKSASAFLETIKTGKSSADEAREAVRKAMLEDAGFKEEEIAKLDLSQMSSGEFQKHVRERLFGALTYNGSRQKVVPVDEVKNFLAQGYEYQGILGNGEAIVKLPF
jgi:hypothetical protein